MKPTQLDIYMRLQQHRRIGNTLFNVMGINYDRPAIFMFTDNRSARDAYENALQYLRAQGVEKFPPNFMRRATLELGPVRFTTLALLNEQDYAKLWGMPISIDHYALHKIIEDDREARIKEILKK